MYLSKGEQTNGLITGLQWA